MIPMHNIYLYWHTVGKLEENVKKSTKNNKMVQQKTLDLIIKVY